MNNKGFTLIELLVAMAIFLVVITIAVGGFVSLVRLQALSNTVTNVQQNARISLEQITRLARQAESIKINENGNLDSLIIDNLYCFKIEEGKLKKFDNPTCTNGFTLTSQDVQVTKMDFTKVASIPALLDITMSVNSAVSLPNQSDQIDLNTSVLLTSLK